MRAKEVEKVSFPQYNSKKEEGPSQDGDYTILTRPLNPLLFFLERLILGLSATPEAQAAIPWKERNIKGTICQIDGVQGACFIL